MLQVLRNWKRHFYPLDPLGLQILFGALMGVTLIGFLLKIFAFNPLEVMHKDCDYELIKDKHSLPLAAMPETKPKPYEIQLQKGDRVFVYTDGEPEAINENEEQYGTDRMIQVLNGIKDKTVEETLLFMSESINEFKGKADQFDDITMLGVEFAKN